MADNVLIIEDSPTDAGLVKDMLKSEGINSDIASSGKEGIGKAKNIKPDLIVLDIMLPDMSGFDVCRELKKDAELKNAIILVLSVKDELEYIKRAFEAGADDYIIKPPSTEFLIKKIKLYLRMRK